MKTKIETKKLPPKMQQIFKINDKLKLKESDKMGN